MKFDRPAGQNPIDQLKVVGRAHTRIEGPAKVAGAAPYAYERHDVVANQAYGYALGSAIAKGRILSMDLADARRAPGVITIVSALDQPALPLGTSNTAQLFGGPVVEHYHQAIAVVVAETFEQARHAAGLIRVDYQRQKGAFDLTAAAPGAPLIGSDGGEDASAPKIDLVGDFEKAFAAAPVKLDQTYTTPDETHAMMEPHASIASWEGDRLTVWTSTQMVNRVKTSLAKILSMPEANIRLDSPYIGGGFGSKLFARSDIVLAALAAKAAKRPVKLALQRPLIANNTIHRPATIQHLQLGATPNGRLTAISHGSTSGNLDGGRPEMAVAQTKLLYAAPHRKTFMNLAVIDLPEGNAMRAPGEAAGLMVIEIAMDEMAEKLGLDPVEFRIRNDTQVDPADPTRRFSQRHLVECLRTGADRFGWSKRNAVPAQVRDGHWLVGMGVAAGFRNNRLTKSGARIRLERDGRLTVETAMTDIGTGSYTVLGQTAAEMMGVPLDMVTVKLGDSNFPAAVGSVGQRGANSSTSGLYAACVRLREQVAQKLGFNATDAQFIDGKVTAGNRSSRLRDAAADGPITAEDAMEYGDLEKTYQQSTFAAHFVEVGVNGYTGETRIRRMLAVCDAGRILNSVTARSQVIGAMTMGAGAALMEELAVDKRFGFFVNHDLASYEVPVHADIPHQEVIFLDHPDAVSSPMKAKGVGELGLCGVSAAIANAIYNATGIRLRDYPMTLDKHLDRLPQMA